MKMTNGDVAKYFASLPEDEVAKILLVDCDSGDVAKAAVGGPEVLDKEFFEEAGPVEDGMIRVWLRSR